MSVLFWSLRGQIPVFICPIVEGTNTLINATPFGVNFNYGGVDYPSQIFYSPDTDLTSSTVLPKSPNDNNGIQDIGTSNYYYVYTFQHFIDLVNNSLFGAWADFDAVNPAIHNSAPWFQYDSKTGLMSLIAERSYSQPFGAKVFMNSRLLNYFEAIRVKFYGYNQPNYSDFEFIFKEANGNQYGYAIPSTTLTNPPAYNKYEQEYDARFLWGNIKSILFTSSSIACREEYVPQSTNPEAFQQKGNPFNPDRRSIISYYDIFYDTSGTSGANWRQQLYYNPPYAKFIDLISNSNLNNINLEVFIQLNDGQLIPLQIPTGANVDIKLVFKKKCSSEYD